MRKRHEVKKPRPDLGGVVCCFDNRSKKIKRIEINGSPHDGQNVIRAADIINIIGLENYEDSYWPVKITWRGKIAA